MNIWQHDGTCEAGDLTEIMMPIWNWLLVISSDDQQKNKMTMTMNEDGPDKNHLS